MKIMVTGGCGFIGSNFIKYVFKNKNAKILNIDKMTYAANTVTFYLDDSSLNYYFSKTIFTQNTLKALFLNLSDFIINFVAELT